MIQFRNYQAASFNILFLVIANFAQQRQIDPSYLAHYNSMLHLLTANYVDREKTNEYVMFLGSTQRMNYLWSSLTTGSRGLVNSFNFLRLLLTKNLDMREKRRFGLNNPATMLMATMDGFGTAASPEIKTAEIEELNFWEEMLEKAYKLLRPSSDEWPELPREVPLEDEE